MHWLGKYHILKLMVYRENEDKQMKVGVSKFGFFNLKKVMVFLPMVVALVLAGFFYFKWQELKQDGVEMTQEEARKEIGEIVKKIGRLVLLPEGEIPVLVKIEDKDKISKNQNFFEKTENGDMMLVYKEAKKAYLYRPSEDKLINMAPVDIQGDDVEVVRSAEVGDEVFDVVIRSSAQAAELSEEFSKILLEEFDDLRLMALEDAASDDYEISMLVVNIAGVEELADEIADRFGLQLLESLPEGEVSSEGALVVILGNDR